MKGFLGELDGKFRELLIEGSWHGRVLFIDGEFAAYVDFSLDGADDIRRDRPFIGCVRADGTRYREIQPRVNGEILKKYELHLLACDAAANKNPKLERKSAEAHAVAITQINSVWSVARMELPKNGMGV
ncbi:hypothetical protein [Algiphilus sp.]|uniref:hypothetical protein n=1 Tax=Algiphilus sp. TaxID=1872431 RepID=UPI0032ECD0C8